MGMKSDDNALATTLACQAVDTGQQLLMSAVYSVERADGEYRPLKLRKVFELIEYSHYAAKVQEIFKP